jgi:hypothetical protein
MPLYGFLEGDVIGLLILASERDSMAELAGKLQAAAAVRVAPSGPVHVEVRGRRVADGVTVASAGLAALDRFDVRRGR